MLDAAPCTPLPFSTSTETLPRGRSGWDGTGETCRTCATVRGPVFATAAAAVTCARCGARCTAPIAISATSSTIAIAPATIVEVRHGNELGKRSACCTARIDSRSARPFLRRSSYAVSHPHV